LTRVLEALLAVHLARLNRKLEYAASTGGRHWRIRCCATLL
jgi:hypothetical protein